MRMIIKVLIACLFAYGFTGSAGACTRVLWADSGQAVLVGRTLDWETNTQTHLWVFPRGIQHQSVADVHSVKWTSRYGSVVAAAYNLVALDGMNEKGLAGNVLWLNEADYGQRNASIPGLPLGLWLQYYLDNFATVADAVSYTRSHPYQLLPVFFKPANTWIKFHLSLQDATGDSAIFEVIKGKLMIYHHPKYAILANSPTYFKQLNEVKQCVYFGGKQPLPGSTTSVDRFIRATYFLKLLPRPATTDAAVSSLAGVLNNVAEPMMTVGPNGKAAEPTYWWTIADLTHLVYYFNYLNSPNRIWVNFNELNLDAGAPVMSLDATQPNLAGDVSKEFKPTTIFTPLETNKAG